MKLSALYEIKKGKKPGDLCDSNLDGHVRFIQIEDLRSDAMLKYCQISGEHVTCVEDDLLIVWDGAYSGLVSSGLSGAFGSTLARLRPVTDKAWTPYVARYLQSQSAEIHRNRTGATIPHVNGTHLRNLTIPLPPLAEQKRIAGILDSVDALRAKRRESLAQLDALLQSTFLDMFGDPAGNGWEMSTVEDVANDEKGAIRTGPFGSQLLHSEFVDEGIRVLGIDNASANEFQEGEPRFITLEKYKQLQRYTVRPGDVLITIMGTCGRCAIVPDDIGVAINTKHLCCITLDWEKCLPGFMYTYFLEHPIARRYLERSAKGAIMSGLNMGIIKALPIPKTPIDVQHRFAIIVESVDQQRACQRAHLSELDSLFASLQQRVFNGELSA